MLVITDDVKAAGELLGSQDWQEGVKTDLPAAWGELQQRLFSVDRLYSCRTTAPPLWQCLFIVDHATASHFDLLRKLGPLVNPKSGIICAARTGERFHGFHGRSWSAEAGNLHLSCALSPDLPASLAGPAFQLLAAVATLRTIDQFAVGDSTAGIKWVNDLLLQGAKVGGVLAQTQTQGEHIHSAVLGIGLNVLVAPDLPPVPSVPRTGSLCSLLPPRHAPAPATVFRTLLQHLAADYQLLLSGGIEQLLGFYRERSLVLGRVIQLWDDRPGLPVSEIASGRVRAIGDDLALYLEGVETPFREGRLVMPEE